MWKRIVRGFLFGVVGMSLFLAGALMVNGVRSAQLSSFSGPGGTAPVINFPAALADLNVLINSINSTLAPAGTGTVVSAIGVSHTASANTGGADLSGIVQFMANGFQTTATSSYCVGNTAADFVFLFLDATGTIRYVCAK